MPNLRLFIAIALPETVRKEIGEAAKKSMVPKSGVRWIKPDHFHVTLHFLGDQGDHVLPVLFKLLESAAAVTSVFPLAFGGLGAFPNLKKPRVLFVPVTRGMEDLIQLTQKISESLKKAGILAAENEFYGHVTLGRVKILKGISKTVQSLQTNIPARLAVTRATGITLFKSELTPEGSNYQVLKEFPFQLKTNG